MAGLPTLSITKAHGSRNEIFVVDGAPDDHFAGDEVARAVRLLCDRERGLGGDGAYFLADDGDGTARAWFFNPDGSEALLCGNGMRGVGRLLLDRHGTDSTVVHTGPYAFTIRDGGSTPHGVREVAVELPPVDFTPEHPIVGGTPAEAGTLFVDKHLAGFHPERRVTALAVPNSHLVTVVEAYDRGELVETGRRVADAPDVFPVGANVSFVLPLSGGTGGGTGAGARTGTDEVFVHTYERGAGLTPSCGSGIAASRAVLSRLGWTAPEQPVLVRNPGGVARSWLQPSGARGSDGPGGPEGSAWQPVLAGNATLVAYAEVAAESLLGDGPLAPAQETYPAEGAAFAQLSEENLKALGEAGVRLPAA